MGNEKMLKPKSELWVLFLQLLCDFLFIALSFYMAPAFFAVKNICETDHRSDCFNEYVLYVLLVFLVIKVIDASIYLFPNNHKKAIFLVIKFGILIVFFPLSIAVI